jgi:hypothetical protein
VTVYGGNVPNTYTVTDTSTSTTLHTGQGNSTINVQGTSSPLTINGDGLGFQTINIGSQAPSLGGTMANISGPVTVTNTSFSSVLSLDDSGNTNPASATISGTQVTGLSPAAINYDGSQLSSLTVYTGSGGAAVTVTGTSTATSLIGDPSGSNTLQGPDSPTTWNITGGDSGNLAGLNFTYSSYQNLTGGASDNDFVFSDGAFESGTVTGGGGNNTLDTSAFSSGETFLITSANSGAATVAGAFAGIQNLIGGGGGNTFAFSDGASVDGNIVGSGADTLDYTPYTTTVIVDLQTGFATGVGGSVSGIQTVIGGSGAPVDSTVYNLLIGNGGDTLTGGTGRRNLLVAGGAAPSTLNAGDGEDLLIGGTTVYDTEAGLGSW